MRSIVLECLDNFSITNLYANLQDRIEFLLPGSFVKEPWKLSGKMYRSKLPIVEGSDKFNSICTLQHENNPNNSAHYLINKEVITADPLLDSIIGKLNLMYSVRQSYSIDGHLWKSAEEGREVLKCATIYSGSEAVSILIQVEEEEIFERVFPDFLKMDENDKIRIHDEGKADFLNEAGNVKKYFEIIVRTVKLNL